MRRGRSVLVLALLSVLLGGCPLIWVGTGVVGGYAISKDSIRNQFELSKEQVFRQSAAVAHDVGFVTVEDGERGLLKLKIGDTTVTITVTPMTKHSVELKVQARNQVLLPQVDVAQSVYNKIAERL